MSNAEQPQPSRRYLRANVRPGSFRSERFVDLTIGGEQYVLIVDENDVFADRYLLVVVVEENGAKALIDLPRPTLRSGSRMVVDKTELVFPEADAMAEAQDKLDDGRAG